MIRIGSNGSGSAQYDHGPMGPLSQAISEGDGISVLVWVRDGEGARTAAAQGAEGLVVRAPANGVREASPLPLILYASSFSQAERADVDAVVLAADSDGDELAGWFDKAASGGLECVLKVADEDDLERVLEHLDPEILLLSADRAEEGQEQLERLLELLPDIPAGKLAIAELAGASAHDVAELERAGVDAVLVTGGDIGQLVGDATPEV